MSELNFDRFTDRAKRVVVLAKTEANRAGFKNADELCLLMALSEESDGVAGQALFGLGVAPDRLRRAISDSWVTRNKVGQDLKEWRGRTDVNSTCRKALELSLREALQLGHNYINTEHILLSLLRLSDGNIGFVLKAVGVSPFELRTKVLEILNEAVPSDRTTDSNWIAMKDYANFIYGWNYKQSDSTVVDSRQEDDEEEDSPMDVLVDVSSMLLHEIYSVHSGNKVSRSEITLCIQSLMDLLV